MYLNLIQKQNSTLTKQHCEVCAAQKSMRMHKAKSSIHTANAAFQITAISNASFVCEMLIVAIVMQFLKKKEFEVPNRYFKFYISMHLSRAA